jgi:hypothetical protein
MLVAWLFALGMGVVNACVVTPPAVDGHRVAVIGQHDLAEPATHAHHGHGDAIGQTGCLKFCADESSTLSKSPVPALDLGLPLLAMVSAWQPVGPMTAIGTRLAFDRPMPHGPPLVIRFLRLTL